MSMNETGPTFGAAGPFIEIWGALGTTEERLEKRLNSSLAELQAFHDAMLPQLQSIIEHLNRLPLSGLTGEDRKCANAALAMCEIDNAVNKWREPVVDTGIDVRRMIKKSSFNDRGC
jgi:hypothetical protein